MNHIPTRLRKDLLARSEYRGCMLRAHKDHVCGGRITLEHALIYAGKQIQARFAIVAVCARGHEVDEYQDAGTMDKRLNIWVALNRATDHELALISKAFDWKHERDRLNRIYGPYSPATNESQNSSGIDYGALEVFTKSTCGG